MTDEVPTVNPPGQVIFNFAAERWRREDAAREERVYEDSLSFVSKGRELYFLMSSHEMDILFTERPHVGRIYAQAVLITDLRSAAYRRPFRKGHDAVPLRQSAWRVLARRGLAVVTRGYWQLKPVVGLGEEDLCVVTIDRVRMVAQEQLTPRQFVSILRYPEDSMREAVRKEKRRRKHLSVARKGGSRRSPYVKGFVRKSAHPLISDSQARWWELMGMSRSAWYEAGKPLPDNADAVAQQIISLDN